MYQLNWSLVADLVSAASAFGTLCVAIWAAVSWRSQLRGGSRHSVAQEVVTAARSLRYAFFGARSPMYEGWEFPSSYWEGGPGRKRLNSEEAEAFQHIYHRRLQELWPSIRQVAELRARAGTVLGDDVATNLENLAKKARELQFYFEQRVSQLRAGPDGVKQWSNQAYVDKVNKSVIVHDPPDDTYSKEFDDLLEKLTDSVKVHL